MHAARQPILNWLLTAVFAAVAIGGQALHDLPGCGHGPCFVDLRGRCHSDCVDHAYHHQANVQPLRGGSDCDLSAADCLICKFFSQGKILEGTRVASESLPLILAVSPAGQAFYPAPSPRGFDARGPPAAFGVIL